MNRRAGRIKKSGLWPRILLRVLCFLLIGAAAFFLIERLLIPKWNYPHMAENMSYTLEEFYSLEKDTQSAVFLGTSHMEFAVSPMEIYRTCGYGSYNLGTSGQCIEDSYFLLEEVMKRQSPAVVVLDVSNLFFREGSEASWRYVLDTMPLSANKLAMIRAFAGARAQTDDAQDFFHSEAYRSALFPIIQYHSRWEELDFADFRDLMPSRQSYGAGYFPYARVGKGTYTVEEMNVLAQEFAADLNEITIEYDKEGVGVRGASDHLYHPQINANNREWFARIVHLCRDNSAELLLVKVPSIHHPESYPSAWTEMKAQMARQFAEAYRVPYLDLLYDVDLGLDLEKDFTDGGMHLNHAGAEKVSMYLGQYLQDTYELPPTPNRKMDADMPLYTEITQLAKLEMEQDFLAYLQLLMERKEQVIICMSASDDMSSGLREEEIAALHQLGVQADLKRHPGFREAYLMLMDAGEVVYEAASNRVLQYEGTVNGCTDIALTSAGWNTGARASVLVNGREEAVNGVGLNIVVIDKQTGRVIDSAAFNTYEKEHTCTKKDPMAYLDEYWLAVK